MRITIRQLRRVIRESIDKMYGEEKQKLLKEEQGMVEQAELKDAVYATFCEWMVEGAPSSKWPDFEAAVLRRYKYFWKETATMKDIELACSDSMDGR